MSTIYEAFQRHQEGDLLKAICHQLEPFHDNIKNQILPSMNHSLNDQDGFFVSFFRLKETDLASHIDLLEEKFKKINPNSSQLSITAENKTYYQAIVKLMMVLGGNIQSFTDFLGGLGSHISAWYYPVQKIKFMAVINFFSSIKERQAQLEEAIAQFDQRHSILDNNPGQQQFDNKVQAGTEKKVTRIVSIIEQKQVNQYLEACTWYMLHLYKDLDAWCRLKPQLYTQIHQDILLIQQGADNPPENLKKTWLKEVTRKYPPMIEKTLWKIYAVMDLKNTLTTEYCHLSPINVFRAKLIEHKPVLLQHRRPDTYCDTFLRMLGVVGASLLGLAGLGVGAFFAGRYAHQRLFGVKGVTGNTFVQELDQAPSVIRTNSV